MIYVAAAAVFIVGFVAGVWATCRAVTVMQEDFVNIFSKPPKGK